MFETLFIFTLLPLSSRSAFHNHDGAKITDRFLLVPLVLHFRLSSQPIYKPLRRKELFKTPLKQDNGTPYAKKRKSEVEACDMYLQGAFRGYVSARLFKVERQIEVLIC